MCGGVRGLGGTAFPTMGLCSAQDLGASASGPVFPASRAIAARLHFLERRESCLGPCHGVPRGIGGGQGRGGGARARVKQRQEVPGDLGWEAEIAAAHLAEEEAACRLHRNALGGLTLGAGGRGRPTWQPWCRMEGKCSGHRGLRDTPSPPPEATERPCRGRRAAPGPDLPPPGSSPSRRPHLWTQHCTLLLGWHGLRDQHTSQRQVVLPTSTPRCGGSISPPFW